MKVLCLVGSRLFKAMTDLSKNKLYGKSIARMEAYLGFLDEDNRLLVIRGLLMEACSTKLGYYQRQYTTHFNIFEPKIKVPEATTIFLFLLQATSSSALWVARLLPSLSAAASARGKYFPPNFQ